MTISTQIQHHHELILNAAGEGIYGVDADGRVTFVNPAAIAMTGWKAEDVLGKYLHPRHNYQQNNEQHFPQQGCPIYAALKDGKVHHITDEIFLHKDGHSFPVHYSSTPIWEKGKITGAVIIFQDVSKLKQAETALALMQRRNELVLSSAGEGICGFDCKGNMTFINPAAANLLGWKATSPFEQKLYHIFGLDKPQADENCPIYNITLGKPRFERYDVSFFRVDGRQFPVDLVSTPVLENGELKGIVIVFRDISKQKKAEQELKNALAEIEQLKNRLQAENSYLQEQINLEHQFEDILGQSHALKSVLHQLEQVAPTDTTALLHGETGTGKELFARAIHNLSHRKNRPLVKVNCAALPSTLIESELFGHEKGSFTGATNQRCGRFELAHEGTIFLDEIGELPLELQAKLLRAIQEGEIERLGGSKTIKVDVRIIAASHKDLKKMVDEGSFRADLFYRLSVFPLILPPLRDRQNDISLLVQYFVNQYANKLGKQITHIPQATMENLLNYPWPGNVRELENVIERAVILSPYHTLLVPTLQSPLKLNMQLSTNLLPMAAMEKAHITETLNHTHWQISGEQGAASILEMHPNTLRSRMCKLGIRRG